MRLNANAQVMQATIVTQRYNNAMVQAGTPAMELKKSLAIFRQVSEAFVCGKPVPADLNVDKFVEDHGGAGGVAIMCKVKPNHVPAPHQIGYMPVVVTARETAHPLPETPFVR